MAWNFTQLERNLASEELKPVYLVAGDEHLLVNEAADAIRLRARELGYHEREVLDVEAGFDWNDLARSSATLSLFSARRLIDLRIPNGKPGKEGSEAIRSFLAHAATDVLLLITASTWSKAHETDWVRDVERLGAFLPCWPLKNDQVSGWLSQRAKKIGIRLTPEALTLLVERTEGHLLAAAQELEKLALLSNEDTVIDEAKLQAWVADHARFDIFGLVDAALLGDTARALRMVSSLRAEGEQVPGMVSWITNQLNLLVRMLQQVDLGQPIDQVLRSTPGVWQNRFAVYRAALNRGPIDFWEARLADTAIVEKISKGRMQGDPWRALERLVAAIAHKSCAQSQMTA